jgi:hypothetical protein
LKPDLWKFTGSVAAEGGGDTGGVGIPSVVGDQGYKAKEKINKVKNK